MKNSKTFFKVCLVLLFTNQSTLIAQDSIPLKKERKNIIRFNLTNPLIFGEKSLLLGYERIVSKYQSFSINAGRASFPSPGRGLVDSTLSTKVELDKAYKDFGFTFALDYRFYLMKENKFAAPRGVYIGPYYNFTHFERENSWTLSSNTFNGTLTTDFTMNVQMIGAQLGYQFILWKRVALDFVLLGPGLAFYNFEAKISNDLNENDQAELLKILQESLQTRFPLYEPVIDKADFEKSGSTRTASLGFRYVIHLGYYF